jgi:uncharacterized protein YecE (DUF72 family)
MLERASGLGDRLGPILLQLPPTLGYDRERLAETLAAFPARTRVAVEFRDRSWFRDEIRDLLADHGAALCLADRHEKQLTPDWRTTDWGYIRFHGGRASPASCYRLPALQEWADRICELWTDREDVFAYFNNDHAGCALRDVARLGQLLDQRGRSRTRAEVPEEP